MGGWNKRRLQVTRPPNNNQQALKEGVVKRERKLDKKQIVSVGGVNRATQESRWKSQREKNP